MVIEQVPGIRLSTDRADVSGKPSCGDRIAKHRLFIQVEFYAPLVSVEHYGGGCVAIRKAVTARPDRETVVAAAMVSDGNVASTAKREAISPPITSTPPSRTQT
jgi:hypothetical protein